LRRGYVGGERKGCWSEEWSIDDERVFFFVKVCMVGKGRERRGSKRNLKKEVRRRREAEVDGAERMRYL
jgi:hypothetical protein